MRKPSFLTVFFIVLGVIFAIALVARIRAYSELDRTVPATTNSATKTSEATAAETLEPADTGTIVETSSIATIENGLQQPNRTSREERYNQLLRSGAATGTVAATNTATLVVKPSATSPPAPPRSAPKPPKPSLVQRIVAPIVKAFGGGSSNDKPPAPSEQPYRGPGDRNNDSRDDNDPTSDTQPPRVLSIDFVPRDVHDGEETLLVITASDDLSGIRNISGSIASPSGALQGFACQREGETDRFVARIAIPKDAAEGTWKVNYLTLTDNASNSVNLSFAQGTLPQSALFRVTSSRPDATGPQLKAIWLERISMKAGEHNKVFVQAEDDKSGVTLVSGVFLSPTKHARVGFGCRTGSSGVWECEVAPPTCIDCGMWQLEQVQLQDKANNMTTARNDNQLVSAVKLDIGGESCDSGQPALTGIVLDQTVVSNAEASTITVTGTVSDDACGVASVSGQAVGPSGTGAQPRIYFSFSSAGDPNTWVGRITIPKLAAKGTWAISWIQVLDKGHNLKTYAQNEPVLSNATFRVQ